MSQGKRYALFMLAMVAWVIFYSLVLRPIFFPSEPQEPPEEPGKAAEMEEKKGPGEEEKTKEPEEDTAGEEAIADSSIEPEERGETEERQAEETVETEEAPEAEGPREEFSFDLFDKEFTYSEKKSIPGEKLVYEYTVENNVVISKIYTINTPSDDDEQSNTKETEPYVANLTVKIENRGEKEFKQKGYLISAGTVSLLTPGASAKDISLIIQRASTMKLKPRKEIYTHLEDNLGGIDWAGVTNKYFAAIIEPVTDDSSDTKKLISRVVINGFAPNGDAENGSDGVLDDSVPHLDNSYLGAMFQSRGGSVSNFILQKNDIVRGSYDKEGKLHRDRNVALHPKVIPDKHRPFAMSSLSVQEKKEKSKADKLSYSIAIGINEVIVPAGETVEHKFRLYVGPKEYRRLKRLGYEQAMNFNRWLRPINILFLTVLHWFHSIIPNYGVAILAVTLMMKLVLYPLDQKSYKSMKEMQKIQPLIAELKAKYKGDPKKAQVEQMKLFKEHKVNPLGGCFPMLLQFPVLIAMFTTLRVAFELRGAPFLLWINDLSQPDALMKFPGGGFFIFKSLNILPLIMVVTFYFQQKMSTTVPKDPNDPQYKQQQMMSRMFPLMFGFIFYNMQSGLTLYFTFSTLLRILQQLRVIKQPNNVQAGKREQPPTKRVS